MNKKIFLVVVYSLILIPAAFAQTWDGSAGTDWNTPANWSTNAVPIATGVVTIPNTANKPVLANNVTIASIDMTAGSAINFNGFSLTLNTSFDVRGAILNNTNAATDIVINTNGAGTNYFGTSTINDNLIINNNSTANFYEGYQAGNIYNGNVNFNYGGTGISYTCYQQKSTFNGNLTVSRTGAAATYIFYAGFTGVTGNFSYTNTIGGATYINPSGVASGVVGGTVNITASGAGNPAFQLYKLTNLTTGGSISIQNSGAVEIEDDTLKLVALTLTGVSGSSDFIRRNSITGNFSFSEAADNITAVYIDGNTINGNTVYTTNSIIPWYEGYSNGCTYNGNTSFNYGGTGTTYISYQQKSTFNGDLTINRTGAGATYIFYNGHNGVTGNFSYTNTIGGATYINPSGVASGVVGGTVNITASGAGNPAFQLYKMTNLTAGGSISVQNSGAVEIEDDTLKLVALTLSGIGGSSDFIRRNIITGDLSFSDAAGNTTAVYLDGNTINGNTTYTCNSAIPWYEGYAGSSSYNGDLTVNHNGTGIFYMAYQDTTYLHQNLTINSVAGIDINIALEFRGSADATIEQLGIQPITMPRLIMNKTGGGSLTLNDSVTVTTGASFTSGNIYSSLNKELIFPNNVTSHTGTSATSHVIGPVIKVGDDIFTFPVGGPVTYNPVTMSAPVGATSRFRAEYKNQNPTIDGYNTNSKAGSFGAALISNAGYWNVQRITGVTNITLTLGFNTNPYQQYPVLASLKVAHWNGAQWDDHGNGGTTGTSASGTVVNSVAITSFSPFSIAGIAPTYFFVGGQPGPGPDGSPIKLKGIGGWPGYTVKQLPGGSYTADSIFLVPNGSTTSFRLKDLYGVEKDTSITTPASPASYISATGNGSVNFEGWRHFVYMRDGGGNMMGAIRDNDLTLGNTTMNTYFSTANVATAPNGNIFLKRSFKITSQFAPVGTKRVRLYISKTEFTNLQAADPTSFPSGINSLTITKYTGAMEDSLFNPVPGGNAIIIPNSDITIADLGTMYSLDIDVSGFSGFYIGGNHSNLNLCTGTTISIPSNVNGTTYQWQFDNGSGYTNIANGGVYSGAGTKTLTLTNTTGSMYGYKLRCFVNGSTYSQEYTIKFTAEWLGTVNNVWGNAANWSCGILPDANTDVILNAGKPNFPQLSFNTSIRSLRTNAGASVTVKTGFTLTILK
ncbi:MAG: hypothetical protein ABI741_01110 [Ferruginibacter sp.]